MGFVGLVFSLFRGILWITGFDRIEDYFAGLKRNGWILQGPILFWRRKFILIWDKRMKDFWR